MKETCNTPAWQEVACSWDCYEAQSTNPATALLMPTESLLCYRCSIESGKVLQPAQANLNQPAPVDKAEAIDVHRV